MTRLYNRESKLSIFTNDDDQAQLVDLSLLDFDFEIHAKAPYRKDGKTHTSPVTAKIQIYKLSQATRDRLAAESAGAEIQTGYDDDITTVFSGVIINITNDYRAPDWVTTVWASDGWDEYSASFFSRSYSTGVPIKTVINDVAGSFAIPVVNKYDRDDKLLTGTVFQGKTKDVMNKLARDYDLAWSISSGAVTIEDRLNPPLVQSSRAVVLSDSLLKGPIVEETLEQEKKVNKKVTRRVRAVALLNQSLFPGVPVKFRAPSFERAFSDTQKTKFKNINENAFYICDEVTHRGSNWSPMHTTEILTREETLDA